jgi:TRAP-type C4-dicarboxylate transport system substrate-binding protein
MGVSTRAFDKLPFDQQQALRQEAATLALRFEDVGRQLDHQLLDEIFGSHGLTRVVPSAEFRRELDAALMTARASIDAKLLDPALVKRAVRTIAEAR